MNPIRSALLTAKRRRHYDDGGTPVAEEDAAPVQVAAAPAAEVTAAPADDTSTTQPPGVSQADIENLYKTVANRSSDPEGMAYWQQDDSEPTDDNVQPGDSLLMREWQTITPSSLAKAWTPPEDAIGQDLGPKQQNIMQNYPQMLSDKMVGAGQAVADMPGKMLDLAQYPGQVLSGEQTFDPHSDADIQKALDLASMTMFGGIGGAPEGAVLGSGPIRKSLNDIVGNWESKGVKLDVSGGGEKPIGISRIVVPEDIRKQGVGSQVMNDLAAHADDANQIMTLTPSKDFGASSVDRLKDFYKQFGFVENKGKNKDYTINDTMYRKPVATDPQMSVGPSSIETAQELANKAVQTYGTTHNIAEAGYVLPNGKMLDFSGRHEAGYTRVGDKFAPEQGERDFLANDRAVDHRDVVHIMAGPEGMEGHEGMTKFMADAGAIRNKPGIGFETAAIPTDKQIKTIVTSHNTKYRGEPMLVELSHPTTGDIIASQNFEKPNVEAIQKWFGKQSEANPGVQLAPKFSRGGKTPRAFSSIPFGPEAAQRAVRIAKQQAGRR